MNCPALRDSRHSCFVSLPSSVCYPHVEKISTEWDCCVTSWRRRQMSNVNKEEEIPERSSKTDQQPAGDLHTPAPKKESITKEKLQQAQRELAAVEALVTETHDRQ